MSLAGRKWEAKAKSFLEDYVKKNTPSGVFVLSCCGSVKSVTLRYASDPDGTTNTIETLYKYFEVLSMTGTLSQEGTHLHITLADNTGRTVGGHLVGNLMVQTTMEIETLTGYFEVLSMTGCVSREGSHLHITLADSTGQTIGGHLMGIPLSTTQWKWLSRNPRGLS
ncbi:bifunctional protein GlmU-like isoform X2 [Oratosquilla oratoria]|uniref:bifunctional protein GlmU-like isoform X2 n=1 Tax=Oratosquilla oratoria TaxID=337810 RepID=UPI003F765E69